MSKMTPEQEARYALNYNVNRRTLSKAAQLEYDRLLGERQEAKARNAAAAEASRHAVAAAATQAIARKSKVIPLSTTDTLPLALGGDKEVKRMELAQVWNYESPEKAEKALIEWAQMHDYDAVIGVRLVGVPNVSGSDSGIYGGSTGTKFCWALYGTAIGW